MRKLFIPTLILVAFVFMASCGNNSAGPDKIYGPELDLATLSNIKLDQLKYTVDLSSEKDGLPEVAVYLVCSDGGTDVEMACVGKTQGLDIIQQSGLTYGKLDLPFVSVTDSKKESCFNFKLIFAEKNSADCPAPLVTDDTKIWESDALIVDPDGTGTLVDSKIESSDASQMAYLIASGEDSRTELKNDPVQIDDMTLKLDQVYFNQPSIADKNVNFLLIVDEVESGTNGFNCRATFESQTTGIILDDIIYGGLDIQLLDKSGNPCTITEELKQTKIEISLYVTGLDKPLKSKESTTIVDLIDNDGGLEKLVCDSGCDAGFVKFSPVKGVQ